MPKDSLSHLKLIDSNGKKASCEIYTHSLPEYEDHGNKCTRLSVKKNRDNEELLMFSCNNCCRIFRSNSSLKNHEASCLKPHLTAIDDFIYLFIKAIKFAGLETSINLSL